MKEDEESKEEKEEKETLEVKEKRRRVYKFFNSITRGDLHNYTILVKRVVEVIMDISITSLPETPSSQGTSKTTHSIGKLQQSQASKPASQPVSP